MAGLTLQNLIDDIKISLRVFDDWSTAHAIGDGVTTRYKLPDYPIVDDQTIQCVIISPDGVQTTLAARDYTIDPASGYFIFNVAPGAEYSIQWAWKFVAHTDEELLSLVNAGVRYISADIKIEGLFDDTLSTDLFVYEYAAPEGATRIKEVELRDSENDQWNSTPFWKTRNLLGQLYVQFSRHPGIREMRIHYDARPVPFAGTKTLEVYDEAISVCLMPETCYDPLLHYAVWGSLQRAANHRTRDDRVLHATDEVAAVTMRDLETRITSARMLFELHLARFSSEMDYSRIIA